MIYSTALLATLLAAGQLVAGHAAIIGAKGDQGGQGTAIAVDASTPRDGTRRNPFQQDSTRFKGASADSCGETVGAGTNNVESGTAAVMAASGGTLPQVSPGGSLTMTVHQVNADGAGPYTCMIDSTGQGTDWQPIQVTTNLEGDARGRNRQGAKTDFPLVAAIPAGQTCTGTVAGQSGVCMVRCQNPARAGPFGGCVPVQMAGAGAGAGTGADTGAAPVASSPAALPSLAIPTPKAGTAGSGTGAVARPATGAGKGNAGKGQQQDDEDEEDEE